MFDPTIRDIAKGEPIRADWLNEVVNVLMASIVVGEGLTMRRLGNRIVIALAENQRQIVPKV